MKVLVVREFWENEGLPEEHRHKPGAVLDLTPEKAELYEPFVQPIKQKREVEKRR